MDVSSPFTYSLFITCQKGLEEVLVQELASLGFKDVKVGFRGVFLEGSLEDVYLLNYSLRTASRVLITLANFFCYDAHKLYKKIYNFPWEEWFDESKSLRIDASVQKHEKIRNSLFACQLVKDGICDRFRDKTTQRPSVDKQTPDVRVRLFIEGKNATLSLDTSGVSLGQRPYRQRAAQAPLNEAIAAGILLSMEYEGGSLCDPCTGSGTFLCEAALLAQGIYPGNLREKFAFENFVNFSSELWQQVKKQKTQDKRSLPQLVGIDRNEEAIESCRENLEFLSLEHEVSTYHSAFQDLELSESFSFFVAHPPFGQRIKNVDALEDLYRNLGNFLKKKAKPGAKAAVLAENKDFLRALRLKPYKRMEFSHGGNRVHCFFYDLF